MKPLMTFFHWVCAKCGALDAGNWRLRPPARHTAWRDDNSQLRRQYNHAWVLGIADSLNVPECNQRRKPTCPLCRGSGLLGTLYWNGRIVDVSRTAKVCEESAHQMHAVKNGFSNHLSRIFPCPCTGVYRERKGA